MIVIKTAELRKLISSSKNIKTSNLLPIYSYIKLVCKDGNATFYKSNGHSFLIYNIEAEFKDDIVLIIDEKTLFGFVSFTNSVLVTIKEKDGKIIITDDQKEISCQSIPDNYPAIQTVSDEEKFLLSSDVLESLFLARNHVSTHQDKAMRAWTSLVHLANCGGKTYVAGLNGTTSYIKKFNEKLPELHLDLEVVSVISKYPALHYFSVGNYDCFDDGNICYGFIKTEIKCPDISIIVDKFKSDSKFTIDRKRVVDFCEMVIGVNDSNIPPEVCFLDSGQHKVSLKFKGISGNQSAKEEIPVTGKTYKMTDFYFQPKNMLLAIKDLGLEEITFSYTSNNLIISSIDDKDYVGSIMELYKN